MVKVYVIIPDKTSGDYFAKVMQAKNIQTEYEYHKIHPRVFDNKIITLNDVPKDLNNIFKTFTDRTRAVVIACNTLQLWLPEIKEEYKKHVKIYTTFEACDWKFAKEKHKPVWIGTTPLVTVTKNFPTLISLGKSETQDLVQELIWRLKMLYGDDYQTASEIVKKNKDNIPLQKLKIKIIKSEIIKTLKNLKVKKVIAGCTELPMLFKSIEEGIEFIDPAEVLSDYIKSQSATIVFAGGTISAKVNKEGAHVGGHVFNLLENLQEKVEGSIKNINITKSEIVYSGLSENMTRKEFNNLTKKIIEIIKTGVKKIIVTHGTDNMEHSAKYLRKKVFKYLKKYGNTVILTGANDSTDNIQTDAWDNLHFSINNSWDLLENDVYIAFNKKFIKAIEARKDFYMGNGVSYISKFDPKYIKNLNHFNLKVEKLNKKLDEKLKTRLINDLVLTYEVNKIRKDHNKFLERVTKLKPIAVLFKLYHSGTANTTDPKSSVSKLVANLNKKGIVCFGATETGEPTDLHAYETSLALLKSGMVPLYDMLYPVAIHKLKLLDLKNLSSKEITSRMLKNYVGEILDFKNKVS